MIKIIQFLISRIKDSYLMHAFLQEYRHKTANNFTLSQYLHTENITDSGSVHTFNKCVLNIFKVKANLETPYLPSG